MRVRSKVAAIAVATSTALAMGAGPAMAGGGGGTIKLPSLSLNGSNNYKIGVSGLNSSVVISAGKGRANASYRVTGTATAKRLKGTFPGFGKVDVKFNPDGRARRQKLPRGCRGTANKVQKGVWKGPIRFKGEGGYTRVSKNSAKGQVLIPGNFTCSGGGGIPHGTTLNVFRTAGDEFVQFSATKRNGSARPAFTVSASETDGSVQISRFASANGEAGDFTFSRGPDAADVSPPGPWSGSAALSGGNWTGNLKVKLPGRNLDLTGGGYSASLFDF